MFYNLIRIIALIILVVKVGHSSDDLPFAHSFRSCDPPAANAGLAATARWAQSLDIIGNRFFTQTAGQGDYQTQFGPIIDRSCFTGPMAGKRDQVIEKMNRALAYVAEQSYYCDRVLGYTPASSILSIIRRSRFHCGDTTQYGMTARTRNYDASSNLFGMTMANYNRNYNITMNYNLFEPGENELGMESFAGLIFHEGAHFTAQNNRHWHGEPDSRDSNSCDDHVLNDRVYYSAVCFPKSNYGFQIQATLMACNDLCKRVFTEVERSADHAGVPYAGVGMIRGPDLNAIAMSEREANILCTRIKSTYDQGLSLSTSMIIKASELSSQFRRIRNSPFYPGGNLPETIRLQELFDRALAVYGDLSNSGNWGDQLSEIQSIKKQVASHINEYCARSQRHSSWRRLCEVRGAPIISRVGMVEGEVETLVNRSRIQFQQGLAPLEDIQAFYNNQP